MAYDLFATPTPEQAEDDLFASFDAAAAAATPAPSATSAPAGATVQAAEVQPALDPLAQNPVVRGVGEVGQALAYPVVHPMGFLAGLGEQVEGVFVDPFVQAVKDPGNIPRQFDPRELTGTEPGLSLIPGYKTSFDLGTPEGRAYLKEHPSQVALDVLGVLGGGVAKPGQRLPAAMQKASTATSKTAEVANRTSLGRALSSGVSGATAGLREVLPSARTAEITALPAAKRSAAMAVDRNIGSLLDDFQRADLDAAQTMALRESLDRGMRPDDPVLAPLYDRVAAASTADRARKLTRDIPDPVKSAVIDQVEATLGARMARTGLGPQRTRAMFDALRQGADNPVIEAAKAWKKAKLEVGRRILYRQRDAKLFEFDPELPGIEAQVYPWRDYSTLRAAKHQLARGKLDAETFRSIVDKHTPGKYEPLLQAQKAEMALAGNRALFEPGFGRAAYDQMTRQGMQTWTKLAEQGIEPVYVPRQALKTLTDEARPSGPRITVAKPSSLKRTTGSADFYETDPALMLKKNEYDLANQTVVSGAIAEVYRNTGGKGYDRALADYMSQGFSQAKAEKLIRDNFRGFKLDGTTTKPQPGMLLVRRDVAAALKHYVEHTMPSLADELFGMWTVPVLWMSPMFHVNNVVGGAFLTALKAPHSVLDLLAYSREASKMVRSGQMDVRIPFGEGLMAPQYTRKFTRASRLAEGGRLAELWKRIPGHSLVDRSRRFNEFMDSFNRSVVYLATHDKAVRKGIDPLTAREQAGAAAANLLQNWDSFSPIERQIAQRVYPFWGWRKAMLRTIFSYPMDHPLRMQFLASLARDSGERENLPEEWQHLLAITGEDASGKAYYLSQRGQDPFADVSDFFTAHGFLQNLHPFARVPLEYFGVDSFRGGVPHFPFSDDPPEVDPTTGRLRRPYDADVFWELIPQLSAFSRAAGLRDIPPPEQDTPQGWLRWLDTYGATLRLSPGISYRSMQEAEEKFRENLKTAARMQAKAQARKDAVPQAEATAAPQPSPTAPPASSGYSLFGP